MARSMRAGEGAAVSPLRRAASGGVGPTSPVTVIMQQPSSLSSSPSAASPTSSSFYNLPVATASSVFLPSLDSANSTPSSVTVSGTKHLSSPIWGNGVYTGACGHCAHQSMCIHALAANVIATHIHCRNHHRLSRQSHIANLSGQLRNGVAHGRGSWKAPLFALLHTSTLHLPSSQYSNLW